MASCAAVDVVGRPEAGVVLADFRRGPGELFEKCRVFRAFTDTLRRSGGFQAQYRVVLEGALDRAVRVREPGARGMRELLCFDSNSTLGLHLDRRVLAAFERVLAVTGCGTPSAPVLSGTHRWLRELEESISAFYGRE